MQDALSRISRHLETTFVTNNIIQQAQLGERLAELQAWQCQRLLASHQDLYQQPRFRPAIEFFVDELYGPKDFSERDKDIARIVPKMAKILPQAALDSLAQALELNALSLQLDFALLQQLQDSAINADSYTEAYAACANQDERQRQIALIRQLGLELAKVTRIKGIGMLLSMSRKPAKVAGFLSLHEFLERGFQAFKQIGEVEDFILPVVAEEERLMHALFAGEAQLPEPKP